MTPTKLQNRQKIDLLKKCPLLFHDVDLDTISILPMLLAKGSLLMKIEEVYDLCFRKLLKAKTLRPAAFPCAVKEVCSKSMYSSQIQSLQALCDLVYSADKFADLPGPKTFLQFCQEPQNTSTLLLYLHIRQFFKIIFGVKLLTVPSNLSLITDQVVSRAKAMELAEIAFGEDQEALTKLKSGFADQFKGNQKLTMHDFIGKCLELLGKINERVLLERLVGLYYVDQYTSPSKRGLWKSQQPESNGNEQAEQPVESRNLAEEEPKVIQVHPDKAEAENELSRKKQDEALPLVQEQVEDFFGKYISDYLSSNKLAGIQEGQLSKVTKTVFAKFERLCLTALQKNKEDFLRLCRVKELEAGFAATWDKLCAKAESVQQGGREARVGIREILELLISVKPVKDQLAFYLEFNLKG